MRVETDLDALGEATAVVEAVAEDETIKAGVLADLGRVAGDDALLATRRRRCRSSASRGPAARPSASSACTSSTRCPKMKLVELAFPAAATDATRRRARALCEALGKTAVEVPDLPGFVVNRLLFPYLFSAVAFLEETGMAPEDVDLCMTLGAGHPMGPLALLDYVGLDVVGGHRRRHRRRRPRAPARRWSPRARSGRKSGRGLYNH